jgi:adenylate cyclase
VSFEDLKATLNDEVSTILDSEFKVTMVKTETVPHSGDGAITFPNFDAATLGTKLIDTAVLYIDIRGSTELNLTHRPHTVAKLYSAFIRAMTHVAQHHQGHVRGIIGDRLMVLFDSADAAVNALECAFSMNTVGKHVLNKQFKANEVAFGIGIDSGKMLATKTGIRRHGHEQSNYRNLVWLGRPANVASKLTDLANKPAESMQVPAVHVAYTQQSALGLFGFTPINALTGGILGAVPAPISPNWRWQTESMQKFLGDLEVSYTGGKAFRHKDPLFENFFLTTQSILTRAATPPILVTQTVWDAYRAAKPDSPCVTEAFLKPVAVKAPGYSGKVMGGDVIYPALKD